MLCFGSCDTQAWTNVLDFVQRQSPIRAQHPGGPACADFDQPINTGPMQGGEDLGTQRTGFTGAPLEWQNADWTIGAHSRN